MSGISSNALKGANYPENRKKYNGIEFQSKELGDGSGLDLFVYGARMFAAQLGRWGNIDPMSDAYSSYSPYQYVLNNPIALWDVDGKWTVLRHHSLTLRALSTVGIGGRQAELIAHYSSVYADNRGTHIFLNNGANFGPMNDVWYRADVDYSKRWRKVE